LSFFTCETQLQCEVRTTTHSLGGVTRARSQFSIASLFNKTLGRVGIESSRSESEKSVRGCFSFALSLEQIGVGECR